MKKYATLELRYGGSGIVFRTTSEEAKKWVIDLVKNVISRASVDAFSEGTQLSKLNIKDIEIAEWLKGQLCLNGWGRLR